MTKDYTKSLKQMKDSCNNTNIWTTIMNYWNQIFDQINKNLTLFESHLRLSFPYTCSNYSNCRLLYVQLWHKVHAIFNIFQTNVKLPSQSIVTSAFLSTCDPRIVVCWMSGSTVIPSSSLFKISMKMTLLLLSHLLHFSKSAWKWPLFRSEKYAPDYDLVK